MIAIKNISKSFGSQRVIDNLTLDINPGETLSIVGPSGVGKSVLLKLIIGILPVDTGEITIFGRSITEAATEEERNAIRADIGVLYQSAALFDSLNVYDNIAFPARQRNLSEPEIASRIDELAAALSLESYMTSIPQQLSIGIRKRVGLARALIYRPKIVLFDEPNTGLDPYDGQEVYQLIKYTKSRWGFTGVVISHEIPEVFQVSDRVAMLHRGGVIAVGTADELVNSENPVVKQFLSGSPDGPITIAHVAN